MLSIGIIGLPNVGKSTLFKALTKKQVDISNYPFTTIDPNVGVIAVPDYRLKQLARVSKSKKIVPVVIEFIDIAGLIKGAAEGEGLGNQFLAHIREVDAIAHVVRVFEDIRINHVHEKIDPLNDMGVIKNELELADLQAKKKRGSKKGEKPLPLLELLGNKKVIYIFNASEDQIVKGWEPPPDLIKNIGPNKYVTMSLKFELMLSESSEDESKLYLEELGLEKPGLNKLIKESYNLLDLITFFTITGENETRAWAIKRNTAVLIAAGKIHTDFEEKFIKAEVISWGKLIDSNSWSKAKEKGVVDLVGKDYIVQEGDVIEIKI